MIEKVSRECKVADGITLVEYTELDRYKWIMKISPSLTEKKQGRAILMARKMKIEYEITV